jgi:hypothetical protein
MIFTVMETDIVSQTLDLRFGLFELVDREDFVNISLHPALVLRSSCIPERVGVNQSVIN